MIKIRKKDNMISKIFIKINKIMENQLTEIEQAKAILKQYGYFVDNLWSTQDVTDRYECTEEQAQDVLNTALTNEWVTEQIFYAIGDACDCENIELIEDDDEEEEPSCDNCGSKNIIKNSSGDISCINCGWDENRE
jgi:hypothetical protein